MLDTVDKLVMLETQLYFTVNLSILLQFYHNIINYKHFYCLYLIKQFIKKIEYS